MKEPYVPPQISVPIFFNAVEFREFCAGLVALMAGEPAPEQVGMSAVSTGESMGIANILAADIERNARGLLTLSGIDDPDTLIQLFFAVRLTADDNIGLMLTGQGPPDSDVSYSVQDS